MEEEVNEVEKIFEKDFLQDDDSEEDIPKEKKNQILMNIRIMKKIFIK